MTNPDWNSRERRLALATGIAPLVASILLAAIAAMVTGQIQVLAVTVAIIPAAYFSLFAFVMPSLMLLRRFGKESLWSFACVCGLSVVLSGLVLYFVIFGRNLSKPFNIALFDALQILMVPGLVAALVGAFIYSNFGPKS